MGDPIRRRKDTPIRLDEASRRAEVEPDALLSLADERSLRVCCLGSRVPEAGTWIWFVHGGKPIELVPVSAELMVISAWVGMWRDLAEASANRTVEVMHAIVTTRSGSTSLTAMHPKTFDDVRLDKAVWTCGGAGGRSFHLARHDLYFLAHEIEAVSRETVDDVSPVQIGETAKAEAIRRAKSLMAMEPDTYCYTDGRVYQAGLQKVLEAGGDGEPPLKYERLKNDLSEAFGKRASPGKRGRKRK